LMILLSIKIVLLSTKLVKGRSMPISIYIPMTELLM